jgi:Nucleotidyltransferase of unknown function (DUF6036)
VRRQDLEHIIRAAADVTGDQEIVVIGSQAILGEHPDAPRQLLLSPEADVYPLHRRDQTDEIDGVLGEGSMFHDTHSYYAHGVGAETATLPEGWEERLVAIRNDNTRQATGLCLEKHDLALSKLAAGREKDYRFLADALREQIVDAEILRERIEAMPLPPERRGQLREVLEAQIRRTAVE